DTYAPLSLVVAVFGEPKAKRALHTWTVRAARWVDAYAGPDDIVAFDAAFDSWVYPAYGANLSREVVFLHPDGGPVTVPPDVQWVAIDRGWSCVFGHPLFVDFSEELWQKYIFRGAPLPEYLVVYRQLLQ